MDTTPTTTSKQAKIDKLDEMPADMETVMSELGKKEGYVKNRYLTSLGDVKRLEMELHLDRKILELEHIVKLNGKQLQLLKEKRKLFDRYLDPRDAY